MTQHFDPERLEERREVTFEKRHFEEVAAVILHLSCHLTFLQPHFSSSLVFFTTLNYLYQRPLEEDFLFEIIN